MAWKAKFADITKMTHTQQAIWWLNGFWDKGAEKEKDTIYSMVQKFKEIEYGGKVIEKKGKAKEKDPGYVEGCDLDEMKAHVFLESFGETLTVVQLRKKLETIDLDKNKKMAISEYLLFKYGKGPEELVKAPQGENREEVEAAQAQVEAVQSALNDIQSKLAAQKAALEQQKIEETEAKKLLEASTKAESDAKNALEAQQSAEANVRQAEEEQKAALGELKAQEDAYHGQIKVLEQRSNDSSLSTVQKSKAVNELAQLKSQDPLPLRQAKITQEAKVKRVEKERKAQEAATAKATEAAQKAVAAKKAAEEQAAKAEAARAESEKIAAELEAAEAEVAKKFEAAQKALEDAKSKGGAPLGAIWWLERELLEMKKFKPGTEKRVT